MSDDVVKNLKKLTVEHEKQLSEIRERIRVIDTHPKAVALVGKCFKYRNGHFFGTYTKGWVYKQIKAATSDGVLVDSFQTEGPDKIEFAFNVHQYVGDFTHPGILSISTKTYNKEFNKMIKWIRQYNKRKTYGK